jgi:hypothetical protein
VVLAAHLVVLGGRKSKEEDNQNKRGSKAVEEVGVEPSDPRSQGHASMFQPRDVCLPDLAEAKWTLQSPEPLIEHCH